MMIYPGLHNFRGTDSIHRVEDRGQLCGDFQTQATSIQMTTFSLVEMHSTRTAGEGKAQ
jgi:hypothetical protein